MSGTQDGRTALAAGIGPRSGHLHGAGDARQIEARYRNAIAEGVSETKLVEDLGWMLDSARNKDRPDIALKVWRFVLEYTIGKPAPVKREEDLTSAPILEALKRGAEYIVQLGPLDEDTEPADIPAVDGTPSDQADP